MCKFHFSTHNTDNTPQSTIPTLLSFLFLPMSLSLYLFVYLLAPALSQIEPRPGPRAADSINCILSSVSGLPSSYPSLSLCTPTALSLLLSLSETENGRRVHVHPGAPRSGDLAAHEPHRVGERVPGWHEPGPGRPGRLSQLPTADDATRAAPSGCLVCLGGASESHKRRRWRWDSDGKQ